MTSLFDRITLFVMVLCCAAGILMWLSGGPMHYFQLESYQFKGYFRTLKRQWKRIWHPLGLYAIASAVLFFPARLLSSAAPFWMALYRAAGSAAILWTAFQMGRFAKALHGPQKKPFARTDRIKRLYAACLLCWAGISAGTALWFFAMPSWLGFLPAPVMILCAPFVVALAGLIVLPAEKVINGRFLRDAGRRLMADDNLIRIGITGSYGKTSVKFILKTILEEKYNVLATPGSFNTPMGLTRIIRERLDPSCQVFIGEMGARHTRDIRDLCRLVRPTIGILTSIGPQHLDTFKTLENIKNTKYDLIRAIPRSGYAVFCDDGGMVSELYAATDKPKAIVGKAGDDLWADGIKLSPEGSSFDLHIGYRQTIHCTTRLLGKYSINNILLAAACALYLGLSPEMIVRGISRLEPVEHRLQLVSRNDGITVIDDAFNSNPSGASQALEVLSAFDGRKIVVTPGMVELGEDEDRYNYEFGRRMASCADEAYLIGRKHTQPIQRALLDSGFDSARIHVCDSLNEASRMLAAAGQKGDVILYENDLPDHYNEG